MPDPLVFLGANTPWVYALARACAEHGHPTTAVATYDWLTYRRLRPKWPAGEPPAALRRKWWVWPPGYVGTFAPVFAPALRWALARTGARLAAGSPPWVVAPYPWFARALGGVPDGRLIYYNLDDYVLYDPRRTEKIRRQEAGLVCRAALTLCLSEQQCETLRARFPERAGDIRHFPLGVVESYLNPHPARVPGTGTVGYVGNLIDRVDWRLVAAVARALPDVEFVFVGGLEGFGGGGARPDWEADRAATLALPNVRRVGPVPQDEVPGCYWSFGVNWIPYATDHAFNQAACPTKIMDGLASGRPVVSTDLPECRLYPQRIAVANSVEQMAATIHHLLAASAPHDAADQVAFARQHTWAERARQLETWCGGGALEDCCTPCKSKVEADE